MLKASMLERAYIEERSFMDAPARLFLKESRLFAALDGDMLELLGAKARVIELSRDQLLFSKGDPADAVYVVMDGQIAVEIASMQGRTARVATLGKGAVFGELAVLDDGVRTADVRACAPSRLLKIGKQVFVDLTVSQPKFSMAIIKDLISKIRTTDEQVENISLHSLKKRLAKTLASLPVVESEGSLIVKITQSELAERLSATREKVNIHLQTIQRSGAISLQRGKIVIVDVDLLGDIALSE